MKAPPLASWGYAYMKYHQNNFTRYKLTEERWKELWEEQEGCCAICKAAFAHPTQHAMGKQGVKCFVDHKHPLPGKAVEQSDVRGLLCFNCNHDLGAVNENMLFLKNAHEYLQKKGLSLHYAEKPKHAQPKERKYYEVEVTEPNGEKRIIQVEYT